MKIKKTLKPYEIMARTLQAEFDNRSAYQLQDFKRLSDAATHLEAYEILESIEQRLINLVHIVRSRKSTIAYKVLGESK
jgi:septation ring formation regulator EzrA